MKNRSVFGYYDSKGWEKVDGRYVDTEVNENLEPAAEHYNSITRNRILAELSELPEGNRNRLLDCASGAVQYPEYIEYSRTFGQRYCVDFSAQALSEARENLTNAGQSNCVFLCEDLLRVDFEEGYFDAAISLHTLYHVHVTEQEEFVERLIKSVREGGKIILVYSNPLSLRACLAFPMYLWHSFKQLAKWLLARLSLYGDTKETLYFRRKNVWWWRRFQRFGDVNIRAYRFLTPSTERRIIPDNSLGRRIYSWLYSLESATLAAYFSDYYMVVIKKTKRAW